MVDVGDVLCVRTAGFFSWLIRFGAKLQGKPSGIDHVAIVQRVDPDGTVWVVEAWATTGVRLHNAADYLSSPDTVTNAKQPKTAEQRQRVAQIATSFLKHGYDWAAVAEDAAAVFHLSDPWIRDWSPTQPPARVVCSSLAAYVYQAAGLPDPGGLRFVSPADWVTFVDVNGWQ